MHNEHQFEVFLLPSELQGHPDLTAMLQAFYSRSHLSIAERLEGLGTNVDALRESLKKYYIGYGHNSIADCGSVTLFIEGVSMLAAKAIQDHPLYNGQETSSRYIDYSNQSPHAHEYIDARSAQQYEHWMNQYQELQEPVRHHLVKTRGFTLDSKALEVAAFDVLRGHLPAGVLTQLSLTGNIRMVSDHLSALLCHPLTEVQHIADACLSTLNERYDGLFEARPQHPENDWYLSSAKSTLQEPDCARSLARMREYKGLSISPLWRTLRGVDIDHSPIFGTSVFNERLDYGSYRDLQRHRRSYIKSSVPTGEYGPHDWYLNDQNLPPEISASIYANWDKDTAACDPYATPLMANVRTVHVFTLQQLAYFAALRLGHMVHPTMQQYTWDLVDKVINHLPNLRPFLERHNILTQYHDIGQDYERRSKQDITLCSGDLI